MGRLWVALTGYRIRCLDCTMYDGCPRMRAPLAYAIAQSHALHKRHRVKVSRFG